MAVGHVELELKYRVVDAAAAARLATARAIGPFRAAGRARQVQIEDRYLDTADGALGRAGYAVRLRRSPTMTIVSAKSTTPAASALHRREELEGPASLSLDPHAWPPSAARALVLEHAGEAPLLEIVTVRQLRRTRTLADESAEVELSVDEVAVVVAGRAVDHFVELEVELRRGDPSALDTLATILAADPDLAPEKASKLDRALAAAAPRASTNRTRTRVRGTAEAAAGTAAGPSGHPTEAPTPAHATPAAGPAGAPDVGPAGAPDVGPAGAADTLPVGAPQVPGGVAAVGPTAPPGEALPAPAPVRAAEPVASPRLVVGKTPGVTADDILAEAGRKVLRFHFARMLAKEAGTRSGVDIEDLHGMRVATRRMRAAWRVFGDGFRPNRTRRLRDRLRVLAGRLGAVRDLDVLIEAALAHQATLVAKEAAAFEPLLEGWRDEREAARIVLLRELDSTAYLRLVEDYRAFVAAEGDAVLAPASPVSPHRVRDTAASRIWLAYEQVRAYESVLRWADIETVHQLRIAGKWLRYTLEFFREALGPEVDLLIPRVVALQDHLGWLHDADVTIALTRQFLVANAGTLSREETRVIAGYLALKERELARLRRTMGVPWRAVSGPPFRRLLGRAVAAL
jgi:CHAD domain-containing protein